MKLTLQKYLPLVLTVGAISLFFLFSFYNQPVEASVSETSDYQATTTAASTVYGNTITGDTKIKSGAGSFGSVVITGANTGVMNFYDATTTNVNLRTGQKATSTILIASFPASAAAGTYTFDREIKDGIFLDLDSGSIATSTITYR